MIERVDKAWGRFQRVWWGWRMLIGLVLLGIGGTLVYFGSKIADDAYRTATETRPKEDLRPAPEPPVVEAPPPHGETPEEQARRLLVEQRGELEGKALATQGTPLVYEFDNTGIGKIELTNGNKNYDLQITKCSATAIWVYPNNNAVKWASVVKTIKPGERIDVRTLRHVRDFTPVEIGERAFFEMDDGSILQMVVVGVLYYNAGDDKDEVRIKYRIYEPGEFLIEPL